MHTSVIQMMFLYFHTHKNEENPHNSVMYLLLVINGLQCGPYPFFLPFNEINKT